MSGDLRKRIKIIPYKGKWDKNIFKKYEGFEN